MDSGACVQCAEGEVGGGGTDTEAQDPAHLARPLAAQCERDHLILVYIHIPVRARITVMTAWPLFGDHLQATAAKMGQLLPRARGCI